MASTTRPTSGFIGSSGFTVQCGPDGLSSVAMKKTFKTTLVRDGSMCFIRVPFDPKPLFG
jgi:hypothetical protein